LEIAWAGSTCLEGSNPSLSASAPRRLARRSGSARRSGYVRAVRRPVIGLCAAVENVSYRVWSDAAVMLPRAYVERVSEAGGLAILLPPDDALAEAPDEVLELLDALVLAGGSDVDPMTYGAAPHPSVQETDPGRDRFELALAHRALERDLPLLGVCRGMQMLNVAAGGTLIQHIPDLLSSDRHRREPGVFAEHEVRLDPGSLASRAVGAERTTVWSHHHQAVDELGAGVVASGWSVEDDLVEAIELPGRRFALGVLWHPEVDGASRVVAALVDEARTRRGAAAPAG
jgi:putative glutamine amidotransferase